MNYKFSFTVSTINPFTDKRLRSYIITKGYGHFISECYTQKEAKNNKWIADYCISYCKYCDRNVKHVPQHSLFGIGKTPKEAYRELQNEVKNFKCEYDI
jgi:hypothetical protein